MMPRIVLMSVDLPDPFFPISPIYSPLKIFKLISDSTLFLPRTTVMPSSSITGSSEESLVAFLTPKPRAYVRVHGQVPLASHNIGMRRSQTLVDCRSGRELRPGQLSCCVAWGIWP